MKSIITPPFGIHLPRRRFLHGLGLAGAALFTTPGLFAEQLALTPRVTEGPFYPDKMPLDTDNDLILLNDSIHLASPSHRCRRIRRSNRTTNLSPGMSDATPPVPGPAPRA